MTSLARLAGFPVLVRDWAFDDGDSAFARRTRGPALRDSLGKRIVFNIPNDRGGGHLRRVQFSRVSWMKQLRRTTDAAAGRD